VVIYDNKAHRGSGHDEKTVLTLRAKTKPFPILLVAGVGGFLVVIGAVIALMRGGGGGNKRRPPPPPQPMGGQPPYGGGYGAPPGGGYGGPQPPGYGMMGGPIGGIPPAESNLTPQPSPGAGAAPALANQAAPNVSAPAGRAASYGSAGASAYGSAPPPGGSVVQVKCPSCGMNTMATVGQASVCFSCGQPLPAQVALGSYPPAAGAGGGGAGEPPTFPLTSELAARPLEPPANPYVAGGGAHTADLRAGPARLLVGPVGRFVLALNVEVRVGRDPGLCAVTLNEPRVSGVHSTVRFDGAQVWVRDETSNNGTYVAGQRIAAGEWVPVPLGAPLRFGPIEFSVQLA
jgi:hypothetical protein